MNREPQSLTSLPEAPTEERRSRMVSYSISMSLRLVCLFLCFIVPGWWVILPVIGVIVLPLVGVALANVTDPNKSSVRRAESNLISITSTRP